MTARETLRAAAREIDCPISDLCTADDPCTRRPLAASLRELVRRIDEEERLAQRKTNESIQAENAGALATWHMISSTLARLDAPLNPSPPKDGEP